MEITAFGEQYFLTKPVYDGGEWCSYGCACNGEGQILVVFEEVDGEINLDQWKAYKE